MPRRKKKPSLATVPALFWQVNPETWRETASIILLLSGLLLLLASLNLAGNFGLALANLLRSAFGWLGYFVPPVMIVLGGGLLLKKLQLKTFQIIGIVIAFFSLPTIFNPHGGYFGAVFGDGLRQAVGPIGSVLVSIATSLIALLLAANTSISALRDLLNEPTEEEANDPKVKINQSGVPVVEIAKRGLAGLKFKNRKSAQAPVMQTPKIVPVQATKTKDRNWTLPSVELLDISSTRPDGGNVKKNVLSIEKALKDFGISVTMGEVNIGPTVTQYTLKPAEGVKLNQITARSNDLALALAAHPIRVEAPIPGKAAVGIEIPNKVKAIVSLREILESDAFKKERSSLTLALGRDVAGQPISIDLAKAPHLLIAGATGSGKSVGINAVILSLLYQNSPADLRLILVDPKRVEFALYSDIPHLLSPIIVESDKTVNALKWAVAEMERRYKVLAEQHKRNIAEYNQANPSEHLPYIVIVIDELADLMAQAANEVEGAIVRLAQMARAVGIHLLVATQRPSVDVITGLIKANITSRIAYAVASQIDSRTIIDQAGAERLLGNGDMLYLGNDLGEPRRIQGVFIASKEVEAVCNFLRQAGQADYDQQILAFKSNSGSGRGNGGGESGDVDDDLYNDAKQLVIQAGKGSASLLQRRLRVGYARAARLLDLLEEQGVIGAADGAKPREVLMDRLDYNQPTEINDESELYR